MEKTLNRSQLEAQLSGKTESISRRLEALQHEVEGLSLRRAIEDKPWIGVGAAIVGGLVVGLLFGGKRKARRRRSDVRGSLVQSYVEALEKDLQVHRSNGDEISDSVARILRERLPLVVYAPEESAKTQGLLGLAAGLLFKQAFGAAVNAAMTYAAGRGDVVTPEEPKSASMPDGASDYTY